MFCASRGTIVFPITYLHTTLSGNNTSECEAAVNATKTGLISTTGELSVLVDGQKLKPSSYWRNGTNECFPLKTELTQWTKRMNWDLPIWGDSYVDGYWLALRFEASGAHTVAIREQPKSSALQQVPYTTYNIYVAQ